MLILTPISILVTFFALFAWSRAYQRWREKIFNHKELIFWTVIWFTAIFLSLYPVKSEFLAKILRIGRGSDAVFAIATIILFYSVYRLYAKTDKHEKDLARLVRELALNNPSVKLHRPASDGSAKEVTHP